MKMHRWPAVLCTLVAAAGAHAAITVTSQTVTLDTEVLTTLEPLGEFRQVGPRIVPITGYQGSWPSGNSVTVNASEDRLVGAVTSWSQTAIQAATTAEAAVTTFGTPPEADYASNAFTSLARVRINFQVDRPLTARLSLGNIGYNFSSVPNASSAMPFSPDVMITDLTTNASIARITRTSGSESTPEFVVPVGSYQFHTYSRSGVLAQISFPNGFSDVASSAAFVVTGFACDSIDFNRDTISPDSQDLDDFLAVLAGGPSACSNFPSCGDQDFNNDGFSPDSQDLDAFLSRLAGGPCL